MLKHGTYAYQLDKLAISAAISNCSFPKYVWLKSWVAIMRWSISQLPKSHRYRYGRWKCLAIRSVESGSVVVSTDKTIIWKSDAGARMGGICWIAAEHAHTGSKFRTTKRDHVFTVEVSMTSCNATLRKPSYRICEATISR